MGSVTYPDFALDSLGLVPVMKPSAAAGLSCPLQYFAGF